MAGGRRTSSSLLGRPPASTAAAAAGLTTVVLRDGWSEVNTRLGLTMCVARPPGPLIVHHGRWYNGWNLEQHCTRGWGHTTVYYGL